MEDITKLPPGCMELLAVRSCSLAVPSLRQLGSLCRKKKKKKCECLKLLFFYGVPSLILEPFPIKLREKKRCLFTHLHFSTPIIIRTISKYLLSPFPTPSLSPISWLSFWRSDFVLLQLSLQSLLFFLQPLFYFSFLGSCVHRFGSSEYGGRPTGVCCIALGGGSPTLIILFWDAAWFQIQFGSLKRS